MRLVKPISLFFALLPSVCLSSTAMAADPKPYVEIGAALSDGGFTEEAFHLSGIARAGVEVTSWAAFEAEGILGLEDSRFTETDGDIRDIGIESQFGGYLRLGIPIDEQFLPYVRLGYATAKTSSKLERVEDGNVIMRESEDRFSGPSFGFGIQGFFGETRQNGVRLDFIGLISDGDEDDFFDLLDGSTNVSVTYVRRF